MDVRWSLALLALWPTSACGEARPGTAASSAASAPPVASPPPPIRTGRSERWPGPSVSARHPATGIAKVVVRTGSSSEVKVTVDAAATEITARGTPTMWGVEGEPTPPSGGFAFATFDDTLLVATRGEFVYIHLGVVMERLELVVPANVAVTKEAMVLNQDREPDLRPPGAPPRSEGRP